MVIGLDLLDTALEAGVAIYIIDKVTGKRKKVYVTKAQAKKIKAKQKSAKKTPAKKKTMAKRNKSTKKKLWWE